MAFTAVQEGLFELHDDGTLDLVGGYSPTSSRFHFPFLPTCPYSCTAVVQRVTLSRAGGTQAGANREGKWINTKIAGL